jgi:hypothetical protein
VSKYKFFCSKQKLIDLPARIQKFKRSKWKFRKNIFKSYCRLRGYDFSSVSKKFLPRIKFPSFKKHISILRFVKKEKRFWFKNKFNFNEKKKKFALKKYYHGIKFFSFFNCTPRGNFCNVQSR